MRPLDESHTSGRAYHLHDHPPAHRAMRSAHLPSSAQHFGSRTRCIASVSSRVSVHLPSAFQQPLQQAAPTSRMAASMQDRLRLGVPMWRSRATYPINIAVPGCPEPIPLCNGVNGLMSDHRHHQTWQHRIRRKTLRPFEVLLSRRRKHRVSAPTR